jgi:hypothetical protein
VLFGLALRQFATPDSKAAKAKGQIVAADPATHRNSPTEVLAGLVDRVTFHNSENGFCVLRVKADGKTRH